MSEQYNLSDLQKFFIGTNRKTIYRDLQDIMDFFHAQSEQVFITINNPDIKLNGRGFGNWVVDLCIQYRPEKFPTYQNKNFWWELPYRNSFLDSLHIFDNKKARINAERIFSVLIRDNPETNENVLAMNLPKEADIFGTLICGVKYNCCSADIRKRILSMPFDTKQSDKGNYLQGVLGLFPDLLAANICFEKHYWRKMFEIMSNQKAGKTDIDKT